MNNYEYVLSFITILLLGTFGNSFGYKWVSIDTDEEIDLSDSAVIYGSNTRHVGRAKHFGKILPAQITGNGTNCVITYCNKLVRKHECQLLVLDDSDSCDWFPHYGDDGSDENSLRIGTGSDNKPMFLAATKGEDMIYHIAGFYLGEQDLHFWIGSDPESKKYYYQCDPRTKWTDSSSHDPLPRYSFSGGVLEDGRELFVARLEHDCNILTGQLTSSSENASALSYDEEHVESSNYQVLIGDESDYVWVTARNGYIPDHAVVQGQVLEVLAYVARYNKTIGYMTYKRAHQFNLEYEILAYNYNNV